MADSAKMLADRGWCGEEQLPTRPRMRHRTPSSIYRKFVKQNGAQRLILSHPQLTLIEAKTPRRSAQASIGPCRGIKSLQCSKALSRPGQNLSKPMARWWRGWALWGIIFRDFLLLSDAAHLSLRYRASPVGPGGSFPTPFRTVFPRILDRVG